MSKLIYAKTKANFNTAFPDKVGIDKSLAFIEEGYFWTHGKFFKLYKDEQLLTASESGSKVTLTDSNGNLAVVFDRGIAVVSGTAPIAVSTTDGTTTISHAKPFAANQSSGPAANSSTSIVVPQLTFDTFGHYVSTTNRTATLNHVLGTNVDTSADTHYLVGSTSSATNTNSLVKTSKIFFTPSTGAFGATSITEDGKALSALYAPIAHVNVVGNGSVSGHVKLSDSLTSTSGISGGIAATPSAVKAVYDYAKSIISSGDAMIFKGVIGASGVISGQPDVDGKTLANLPTYKAGWTFRVNIAQTIAGLGALEIGDLVMAIKDRGTAYAVGDFTVAQTDIDGAVTASGTLTNNTLIFGSGSKAVKSLGNGTNGQLLAMYGSTPAWITIIPNTLAILNGAVTLGAFDPLGTGNNQISFGSGLTASISANVFTINHSNTTAAQSTTAVRSFTYDSNGHITGSTIVTSLPTANPVRFYNGGTALASFTGAAELGVDFVPSSGDIRITSAYAANKLTYTLGLTHRYRPINYSPTFGAALGAIFSDTQSNTLSLAPGNANVSMSYADNILKISSVNTWRQVMARNISNTVVNGIDLLPLKFGQEFIWANDEINLGWAEVSSTGTISYSV